MSKGPKMVDFTDEDALKFRIARYDPVARAKLYEETAPKKIKMSSENSASKMNEYGFTDDEVKYIKDTFSETEGGKKSRRMRRKSRRSKKSRKTRRKSRRNRRY